MLIIPATPHSQDCWDWQKENLCASTVWTLKPDYKCKMLLLILLHPFSSHFAETKRWPNPYGAPSKEQRETAFSGWVQFTTRCSHLWFKMPQCRYCTKFSNFIVYLHTILLYILYILLYKILEFPETAGQWAEEAISITFTDTIPHTSTGGAFHKPPTFSPLCQ